MVIQHIDGISFEVEKEHDFTFLHRHGKVFRVFDDQDSGNICFGIEANDNKRKFIKYAGAVTKQGGIHPQDAVRNLKAAVPVYCDLVHPALIHLTEVFDTSEGFGMVFDWEDGDCMGRMYPEEHKRFCALPQAEHLKVFETLMRFLAHTAQRGYVAVDFYDGSVMYDTMCQKTIICDIDFFRRQPAVNDMGRMWGSSRFMSPEEFTLHAPLDEITNVYTLGSFAFALFGNYSRAEKCWTLSPERYQVAQRAISYERANRQQSIEQLILEWNHAD